MGVLYDFSANTVRRIYDTRISGLPVLDMAALFPNGNRFKQAWPQLREEALKMAAQLQSVPRFHELMASQAEISANDGIDWRVFVLKAYGVDITENQAACPQLAQLLAASPDVLSASLSFLAPHKHIPRHRGPFRGVLRFQLGLSVPVAPDGRPAAILSLNDREHRIGDGQALLWDDTFPHEVWNRSDEVRIALLLDVRRRGMPLDMALLSRLVIGIVSWAIRLRRMLEPRTRP
jgi:aspartate beta-hydroxylase